MVIVSQAMARRFWPDGEAVGQIVRPVGGDAAGRVVGVARDIDVRSLGEPPRLMVYLPYSQHYASSISFIARTSADAEQTALALLTAAQDVDAELPVWTTTTMEHHL